MKNDYTPQEVAEMCERNENFNGKIADFKKVQLYHEVKKEMEDFSKVCDDIVGVDCTDLNPNEKNAILWADLKSTVYLDDEETKRMASIVSKADCLIFASCDNAIRVVVGLKDIWEK